MVHATREEEEEVLAVMTSSAGVDVCCPIKHVRGVTASSFVERLTMDSHIAPHHVYFLILAAIFTYLLT